MALALEGFKVIDADAHLPRKVLGQNAARRYRL
jgi:hypothetical protein